MNWTHPFDREDASKEMRICAQACILMNECSQHTPVGNDIDAPEWAIAAITWAESQYQGFDWGTMMWPELQKEKTAAYEAAAKAARTLVESRQSSLDEILKSWKKGDCLVELLQKTGPISPLKELAIEDYFVLKIALFSKAREKGGPIAHKGDNYVLRETLS